MAEVDLGRLADIAAAAGQAPSAQGRRPSGCRNPECRNGLTPGLAAVGGGAKGAPLYGPGGTGAKRLMRWAWVRCLACNAPSDARRAGAVYKPLRLADADMAQRAELATAKAPYTPQVLTVKDSLGKLAGTLKTGSAGTAPASDSGRFAELLGQNQKLMEQVTQLTGQLTSQNSQFAQMNETMSRMTMQVASLLEDNAKLRKELEGKKAPVPSC